MIKLDAYDKKILEILIENSREQISSISKKIRLKRENVNYKINRLIKGGLITHFNAVINESKLNLSHYVLSLQLINLKEKSEVRILNHLKESKFMGWAGTSAGKWSLIVDIIIPKKFELDDILNDFLSKFGNFISDYVLLKLNKGEYFNSKLLGINKKIESNKFDIGDYSLDEKDLRILSLLNSDSRITLVDISEKVKLTPNGVNNRIKNLEKRKFILSYTISLDWKKLDYEWYDIQINLIKFGDDSLKLLEDYFRKNKKVILYYKYLGGFWDYDVGIIVKNSNELRDIINEFRENFSDVAKISDIFVNLEETTSNKLPKGIFE